MNALLSVLIRWCTSQSMKDGKAPREAYTEMIQQVFPSDSNALGTVFGGKVLQWIDSAGAICAMRHVGGPVVTASIDRVDFHAPGRIGDVMVLKANVHYAGRSSLQVGVEVLAENPFSGKRVLTTEAILTFVAIDKDCKPVMVPKIFPETELEKRLYRRAQIRREKRNKVSK